MAVGHLDQYFGEHLRVFDRADEIGDFVVGNFVDQTVATQHETIAAHNGQAPRIAAHGGLNA